MQSTTENTWLTAPADVIGSQYRHVINTGERELVGYSKKKGFAENSDQRNNLAKIIIRLIKSQLPKGFIEIEIFQRHRPNGTPVPYREEKIIALYEDGYDIYGNIGNDTQIKNFLSVLYNTSDAEKALKQIIGNTGCVFTGRTYEDLVEQCKNLKNYYPEDKVRRLYLGICRKYEWEGFHREKIQASVPQAATGAMPISDLLSNMNFNQQ